MDYWPYIVIVVCASIVVIAFTVICCKICRMRWTKNAEPVISGSYASESNPTNNSQQQQEVYSIDIDNDRVYQPPPYCDKPPSYLELFGHQNAELQPEENTNTLEQ